VAKVGKYKEKAPQIRFLTMKQIAEQLEALEDQPLHQTLVAMYIYAGLRREETLWLTMDDIDLKAGAFGMNRVPLGLVRLPECCNLSQSAQSCPKGCVLFQRDFRCSNGYNHCQMFSFDT